MGQIGSYVEHEYDLFIKRVSHVNMNITWTHLVSTHDLFINRLVISNSQVVSNFVIPKDKVQSSCFTLFNKKLSH